MESVELVDDMGIGMVDDAGALGAADEVDMGWLEELAVSPTEVEIKGDEVGLDDDMLESITDDDEI